MTAWAASPSFIRIASLVVHGFLLAVRCRLFARAGKVLPVPEVHPAKLISDGDMLRYGQQMKTLIGHLLFWNPGPCFYQAFTILFVLRHLGWEVELNFGIADPFAKNRKLNRAHCWLTIDGRLFLETASVVALYPVLLGRHERGILYWGNDRPEPEGA